MKQATDLQYEPKEGLTNIDGITHGEYKGMKVLETQEGGDHYKNMAIQPIEYTTANNLGFCEGNVVKYVSRWQNKNGLEDLRKAKHYIDVLIDIAEGKPLK